jgi:hypothetical protein
LAKAARITQRLCGTGERPNGMHRRTYERLLEQLAEAERPRNEEMMWRLHGLLAAQGLLSQTEQIDVEQLARRFQQALEKPERGEDANRYLAAPR